MKKKILSLVLVAALTLTAVGSTLAYFTDTDTEDNVFAIGNVDIELLEHQRVYDDNGKVTGLEEFKDNKTLLPIVGSAQGEKDEYGMPTAANYVDKIVRVENKGKSDAYVRVFVAMPVAMDNVGNASQNVFHYNSGNKFVVTGGKVAGSENNENPAYAEDWGVEKMVAQGVTIDDTGVQYNIYCKNYLKVLAGSDNKAEDAVKLTGTAAYVGFYMDKGVDYVPATTDDNGAVVPGYYTINGTKINYDFTNGVKVPVYVQAIQAAGFETVDEAFETAQTDNQMKVHPWAK